MKKIFTFCVIFFAVTVASFAQFNNFLAKDGFSHAITKATEDGLTNPQALFIGTLKRTIMVPVGSSEIPVDIVFNLDNGKANVWVYILQSADNIDNIKSYAVVDVLLVGKFALEIPIADITGDIEIDVERPLVNIDNMADSDVFAQKLNQNSGFMDFMNEHPDPENIVVGILINTRFDFIPMNQSYWVISVTDNPYVEVCAMSSDGSGDVTCSDFLPVEELTSVNDISVSPNPAADFVKISVPETYFGGTAKIIDILGNVVKSETIICTDCVLDVSTLPRGSYIIVLSDGNNLSAVRFIKR